MKKKLVIITEALGGGVRRHVVDLLENLDKDKFDIYFMYNLGRADEVMIKKLPYIENLGVKLIEIEDFKRDIGLHDIKAMKNIYQELKNINPDIVHCHSSKAGILGRVAAKTLNIKQIYYTPHGYIINDPTLSKSKFKIYLFIESIMSKYFTTKTIVVSESEKKLALDYKLDKSNKFEIIHNGISENYKSVDELKLKEILGINKDDIIVGVAERMAHPKDPITFLKIANNILSKYKNVTFVYIGDGEYKEQAEEYIHINNIEDKVKLLGFRDDVEELLNIIDIYLATSLCEGLPYSLIEALKYSTPIVATNTSGHNNIVENERNGLLFRIGDVNDGVSKLQYLIENKDTLYTMNNKAKKVFKENFLIKDMIENTELLYNQELK